MSALPPKADIKTPSRDVRFVPIADIHQETEPSIPGLIIQSVGILAMAAGSFAASVGRSAECRPERSQAACS